MKRALVMIFTIAAVFSLCSVAALAQSNGIVKGVVKDSSGAVLPGAQVTLTNKATQNTLQTLTNETGSYTFNFLPPGEYGVTFEMQGFRKLTIDKITVNVAQTVASRSAIEAFLKKTGAQLWIQHDFNANARLKKAPQFYE